jgi:uncharacterized membrane protein YvbJ
MNCPNCGLANPDGAKFCSNCGTSFGSQAAPHKVEAEYEPPPPFQARAPYQASGAPVTRNTMMRNIGLGCLIAVVVFLLFGLSCARACFAPRRRRYIRRRY